MTEYARGVLFRGQEVGQMMKVVGEEGTGLEDFLVYLKSEFLDAVYLQQNAFDPVDASVDTARQRHIFDLLFTILGSKIRAEGKEEARGLFSNLRQKFIDYNGAAWDSDEFKRLEREIRDTFEPVADGLLPDAEEARNKRGAYA